MVRLPQMQLLRGGILESGRDHFLRSTILWRRAARIICRSHIRMRPMSCQRGRRRRLMLLLVMLLLPVHRMMNRRGAIRRMLLQLLLGRMMSAHHGRRSLTSAYWIHWGIDEAATMRLLVRHVRRINHLWLMMRRQVRLRLPVSRGRRLRRDGRLLVAVMARPGSRWRHMDIVELPRGQASRVELAVAAHGHGARPVITRRLMLLLLGQSGMLLQMMSR